MATRASTSSGRSSKANWRSPVTVAPGLARRGELSQRGPSTTNGSRARQAQTALPATRGINNRGKHWPPGSDSSSTATGPGAWSGSSLLRTLQQGGFALGLGLLGPGAAVAPWPPDARLPPGKYLRQGWSAGRSARRRSQAGPKAEPAQPPRPGQGTHDHQAQSRLVPMPIVSHSQTLGGRVRVASAGAHWGGGREQGGGDEVAASCWQDTSRPNAS